MRNIFVASAVIRILRFCGALPFFLPRSSSRICRKSVSRPSSTPPASRPGCHQDYSPSGMEGYSCLYSVAFTRGSSDFSAARAHIAISHFFSTCSTFIPPPTPSAPSLRRLISEDNENSQVHQFQFFKTLEEKNQQKYKISFWTAQMCIQQLLLFRKIKYFWAVWTVMIQGWSPIQGGWVPPFWERSLVAQLVSQWRAAKTRPDDRFLASMEIRPCFMIYSWKIPGGVYV